MKSWKSQEFFAKNELCPIEGILSRNFRKRVGYNHKNFGGVITSAKIRVDGTFDSDSF